MKVILLQDVKNVGKKNQVVDVAEGYANNFLIKKGLAILQNKANLMELNKQKEEERKLDVENSEKAISLREKLKNITLSFKENAGTENRLHRAITAKMIEEKLLNDYQITVDKKNFRNFTPIKCLGKATVEVVLYKDIVGKINILIDQA